MFVFPTFVFCDSQKNVITSKNYQTKITKGNI